MLFIEHVASLFVASPTRRNRESLVKSDNLAMSKAPLHYLRYSVRLKPEDSRVV